MLMAKREFSDKKKDYLVICDHIGDFLITMGFLDSFKAYHDICHLTIYVTPKMESLAHRYMASDDQLVCLKRKKLDRVLYLNTSHFTTEWVRKRGNIWLVEPAGHFNDKDFGFLLSFPEMNLRRVIQLGCMKLPEQAAFRPLPLLNEHDKTEVKNERVVLCPAAQASWAGETPKQLFETLAESLARQGKEVYTNLAVSDKKAQPIAGTKPLRLSLKDLECWLTPGDWLIGYRSGLMDYTAYCNCHLITLYPQNTRHRQFFSLEMLPDTRSPFIEYELSGDADQDRQYIVDAMAVKQASSEG